MVELWMMVATPEYAGSNDPSPNGRSRPMIRGILIANALEFMGGVHGEAENREMLTIVCRRLGIPNLENVRPDAWYPLDIFIEMADYYRVLLGKDANDWGFIRTNAKKALVENEAYRAFVSDAETVEELLDAIKASFHMIFNRGKLTWKRMKAKRRVGEKEKEGEWARYVIMFSKFKGHHRFVCECMIGMLEAVLEVHLKHPVNIIETRCIQRKDPRCEFTFSAPVPRPVPAP